MKEVEHLTTIIIQWNLCNLSTQGTTEIIRIMELFELGEVDYKEKIAVGEWNLVPIMEMFELWEVQIAEILL